MPIIPVASFCPRNAMNPSSFSSVLNANSSANQTNVASTSPSFAISPGVRTPVIRNTASPTRATAVASKAKTAADAHSATMVRKVTATIHSCRLNGPSAFSAARAALGASGVARTSGAMMRKSTIGSSTIAVNVGTEAATNHLPKPISRPYLRAISHPSGFAAIAVSHSAEDRLRLAIPENIRKLPRRARCCSPGLDPEDSASDTASGYKTPERAVLLGNAGAITASTTKRLYDSPSVDLPNTLTAR